MCSFVLLLLSFVWSAPSEIHTAETHTTKTHTVRPQDTLSKIAKVYIGSPVYTSGGALDRLLALNPQIQNPNIIYVGQVIYLTTDFFNNGLGKDEPFKSDTADFESGNQKREPLTDPQGLPELQGKDVKPGQGHILSFGLSYNALKEKQHASASKAYAYSDLSPGVSYSWYIDWQNRLTTSFDIDVMWVKFIMDGSHHLAKAEGLYSRLGFSFKKDVKAWQWTGALAAENQFLLKTQSLNTLEVANSLSPSLYVGVARKILESPQAYLLAGLETSILVPMKTTSYSFKEGYGLKLYVQQGIFNKSVRLYYLQKQQDTNEISQTMQRLGADIEWTF